MRRGRLALALALVGIALVAVAAGVALARGAPERLRSEAERRLSEALATEVRIADVGLSLRWGLLLEARGVTAWPRDGAPALQVARLHARPDWSELLAGRFRLGWLGLEDARLAVARGPGGLSLGTRPPEDGAVQGDDAAPPFGASALVAAVEDALHAAVGGGVPVRSLRIEEGRIELHESGPSGERSLVLADAEGRAHRTRLRTYGSLHLDGRLRELGVQGARAGEGRVALRAEYGPERALAVDLEDLPLELLAPWARALGLAPGLAGRASGELDWRWEPGGAHRIAASLEASELRLPLAAGARPLRRPEVALDTNLTVSGEGDVLRLAGAELRTGGHAARIEGALGLPVGAESALRLQLATGGLPLAEASALAAALPAKVERALAEPLGRLEAGRLASLDVELDTTWEGAKALVASRGLGRPGALAIRARVEEAALRVAAGERLHGLSGALAFEDGSLQLDLPSARLEGSPLPALGAHFRGLDALAEPERIDCSAPPPVPALPGWRVLQTLLTEDAEPDAEEEGWRRITLRADGLAHPVLLCVLEQAAAELTPAVDDGFAFELTRGRWAGLSLRARGRYAASPEERLALEVELGAPSSDAASRSAWRAGDAWARGTFRAEIARAGPFAARSVEGRFRAAGERLFMERTALALDPGGEVRGELALALGDASGVPYRARVELGEAPLAELLRALGEAEPGVTGRLSGAGVAQGRLEAGRSPIAGARGTFSLHARDGTLRREVPPLLAIALASEGWNPFRQEDRIAYRALDVVARLDEGFAVADTLALDAGRVRAAGSGRVALDAPHAIEGVVGLYLFRTLDAVLGRIPVLNRALLGKDENLVGAYFELSGPWGAPKARLVPVKTMATGPASLLLEGVPDLFAGSVRRLQSVLLPEAAGDGAAEPAEPGAR